MPDLYELYMAHTAVQCAEDDYYEKNEKLCEDAFVMARNML